MIELSNYQTIINEYDDRAMQYCLNVLSGKIIAGELIKLACERHIKDLARIKNDEDFNYTYSTDMAEGIINFAELIPDVSTGKFFKLAQFQAFILSELEAWTSTETGGARFKKFYISMSRTNSKTQLGSIIALRDFLMGTPATSRQVVVASNNSTQITQLYNYIRLAWHSLERSEWFKGIARGVTDNSQEMRIDKQNTRLIKLSAEGIGADSVHPTLALFDEYHLQKTTDFLDSLSSGNVQNPDARLGILSTAGADPKSPMAEDYKAYSEQLKKLETDKPSKEFDEILFLCWEQDESDEAFHEDTWIKSNPLMEVPVMKRNLTAGLKTERANQLASGRLPQFLVKNMNLWQNAKKNAFLPLELLEQATSTEPFNFDHRQVYIGYDASLANDDTGLVFLFPYINDQGAKKFYIYTHSWIPWRDAGGIEAKIKRDGINYKLAEQEGFATITKNRFGTVNQQDVFDWLMDFVEKHDLEVLAVGYDSWGTGAFIRALEDLKDQWLLFPIRQGAKSLSEPTKFLQDGFNEGRFVMPSDRILKASLSNAILTDKDNQLLIDKNINSAKIDVVDAIIDALYQGQLHFTNWTNEPDDKSKSPFKGMNNDQINNYFTQDFSF